ncbi:Protein ANTAGONIST OF LIKE HETEROCHROMATIN PROTEIN 1 [Labeo rohita]|uniref:Protein ANTAGONIST OF LIKE HETEROCHROMATIN PROTEIN 1 n=1 Tax=Labeo rohita TaxID=84645 RepID=A0ABQ8L9V9_LABRO|nr:Protein ANTAGONIST OF LIKE HETEROCHROMATIN PROTEIN 1 [Labeo rohita]
MRRTAFLQLCNSLQPHLQRQTTTFRKPVPVDQCVAICIWRLATNVEFRTISHLFGIGQSTAVSVTNHVASAIVKNLLSLFIRTPSEQEFESIIQGFRDRWGFPQCGGAIDGTHIGILAPPVSSADYYNRKGFYSVILQERFEGVDVPVVILEDAAYPLLPWLMKPYPENQQTTPAQATFNNRLSKARMTVERAFDLLKGRWRCLMKRCDCHIDNINTIISACCMLHNFCQVNGEECEEIAAEEENLFLLMPDFSAIFGLRLIDLELILF